MKILPFKAIEKHIDLHYLEERRGKVYVDSEKL